MTWINADNRPNAPNVHLTTYTTEDHNATWTRAFNPATKENGVNVYEWMLRYTRTSAGGSVGGSGAGAVPGSVKANAGADIKIDKSWNFAPLLNGTLSTAPGGWLTKWTWTKVAGPASYTIANPNAAQTRVSGLGAGTYTFRLTVTSNTGVVGTDDVNVIVSGTGGTTGSPTVKVNAGADLTIDKSWNFAPLLNGTLSTVPGGGWFVKSVWTKIAGPASFSITSPNATQTRVSGLSVGTYTFRLTMTTNTGVVGTDDVNVIVTGTGGTTGSSAVKVNAGADAKINKSWNFAPLLNGTLSKVAGGGWFVKSAWTKIAGPASYSIASPSATQTRVSGLAVGTYTFRLTMTTNTGAVGTDDVNVVVVP